MTENEIAFFAWYEKIQANENLYNLRMAFDAGFESGKGN